MYSKKDQNNSPKSPCAKTRQELAEEYQIGRNTFARRLKKAGIQLPPGLVYPADQKRIYEKLGNPNP